MTLRIPGAVVCTVISVMALAGCAGIRQSEVPPDEQFGHRYEGKASDGRETIVISAPEESVQYVFFAATHDTVHIRHPILESPLVVGTQVETLLKGAFPDACTQLHSVAQERTGHIINVDLQMRRPRGVLCASVVRPYRFYLTLDGLYEPGHYTLKINGVPHPFVIRPYES